MKNNRTPIISITGVEDNPDRFVASFRSEFLDATYAVVFSQTITGAVALHRFVQMICDQYGKQVELRIANDLFPVTNKAVEDILKSIMKPEPALA
jgi:acyl carrier protein phosphodiesterase